MSTLRNLTLLLARVVIGGVFLVHGLQKFLQWGIGGTATAFSGMGIPVPGISAWASAVFETAGGAAMLIGLALPLAGILLALDMIGALVFVHFSHGFFVTSGGFEYVLTMAAASLALGFNGGAVSLDRALTRSRRKTANA